ncbi:hypothetical protein M5K25_008193 [Dendrobium thyrsiflorum]|uniref:DUF4283 domain-containing protein n=1 Tax=Dendrobium thyrsiflorum TaxID=117978 RepID=A0ABD0V832_DENTH
MTTITPEVKFLGWTTSGWGVKCPNEVGSSSLVIKWSPLFDISAESPIILIWISFPKLQPHFFSHRILHGLGSLFGRPLQIDNATAMGSRPSVVRVLVEIDVTKQYPASIWLGPKKYGYVQKVVMDDFTEFCDHCKMLGHCKSQCYHLNPHLRKTNVVKAKTIEVDEPINPNEIVSNQTLNICQTPSKILENSAPLTVHLGNGNGQNTLAKAYDLNNNDTITHQDDILLGGKNTLDDLDVELPNGSKSLSLDVSNMVPAVVITIISATNLNVVRENVLHSDTGLASNADSGSVCSSDKSDDQWEEREINSDVERYTLKESHNAGYAFGSKDDSDWTYVKGKNRANAPAARLAGHRISNAYPHFFDLFMVPNHIKGLIYLDAIGIPYV